jgi:hypothetical protein
MPFWRIWPALHAVMAGHPASIAAFIRDSCSCNCQNHDVCTDLFAFQCRNIFSFRFSSQVDCPTSFNTSNIFWNDYSNDFS